jgi:pyruvate formate lyase activating enzyme
MQIAGLVKTSLIDYPGLLSAVIFTQGCNFRCGFCHNPDLIPGIGNSDTSEIEFFEFLERRRNVLEGIVITGGEPTIQPDLMQFISRVRDHRLKIKLDTNGSNPETLKRLLETKLIDYIAMDIKGSLENYNKICRFGDVENIIESIELVKKSGLLYEFRTTAVPEYHKIEDFDKVGELVKGAERFVVQGFRSDVTFDKTLKESRSFNLDELKQIANIIGKYVKEVVVRDNL